MDKEIFPSLEKILRNINRAINTVLRKEASKMDINLTQFYILTHLNHHPLIPIGELSRQFELSPSTVTAHMDVLEGKGLTEREREDEDRRVVKVNLTEKGRAFVAGLIESRTQVLREALVGVEEKRLKEIEDTLNFLLEKLGV